MGLSAELHFDIISAALSGFLILTRCAYRLLFRCKVHSSCHRQWRIDDTFMALALLPLAARTSTITLNFVLDPLQLSTPPTASQALATGLTMEELAYNRIMAKKLVIPGRICYALFLWTLKLCLLSFYSRLVDALEWGSTVIRVLRFVIIATFGAVLLATLTECRPLHLMWELAPPGERDSCTRGLANLMTMATFNILTDIALIILPFRILKFIRLDRKSKIQLTILFSIGLVVVVITILRIPLIFLASVSQRSRSMWASIEILIACIVANAAFFLAIAKDLQGQHDSPSRVIHPTRAWGNLRLDNLPTSIQDCSETEVTEPSIAGSSQPILPIQGKDETDPT